MKTFKIYLKSFTLFYILWGTYTGNAQCTVTLSPSGGAYGYATFYTAVSSNSLGTYYWNFGNGITYSVVNQSMATETYTANGVYTVSVVFVNTANTCSSTTSATINIFNVNCGLTANYTASTSANTTTFTSISTGTTATTTYSWNYGDGNSGTGQQSTHTYSVDGNYLVTLYISDTSPQVCSNSVMNNVGICTQTANFSYINYANGAVGFTLSSPSPTPSYVTWDFGDGTPVYNNGFFNVASFTYTYALNGTYTVQLSYSYGSCTLTAQNTINVSNIANPCAINANFGYIGTVNTIINFSNTSSATSPSVTYNWDFGDGSTSTQASPSHSYATTGSYTVSLIANNNYTYSCADTSIQVVVVNSCTLAPTISTSLGPNGLVSFTTSAANTTTFAAIWFFGDGSSTYYDMTPTHFYNYGTYTVTLVTFPYFPNGGGSCVSNTLTTVVTVTSGNCIANAGFSLASSGTPQNWNAFVADGPNIANATWNWGDGSTSNTLYTSHTYSAAGYYTICLTVTNTCGATATNCIGYNIYRPANGTDGSVISVTVIDLAAVGIKNKSANVAAFNVAPNPNNGVFRLNVMGATKENANVQIYNAIGQLVYAAEETPIDGNITKEIRLDNMTDGVYFIKLEVDGKPLTKKIIVSKN